MSEQFGKDVGSARPYLSARSRAMWSVLFLIVHGVVIGAAIASTFAEIDLLKRIESGEIVSDAEPLANDNRQAFIGLIYNLSFLLAAISFLVWLYRVSRNLDPLGLQNQRFSSWWSVVCWFIPIITLFRPYQVMKEIWKGSLTGLHPDPMDSIEVPTSPLLGPWWATWLIGGFIGNFVFWAFFRGLETVQEFITADFASIVADSFLLIALVLVVTLIWQITANQEARSSERLRHLTPSNN